MRLVCAPENFNFAEDGALNVVLYGQPGEIRDDRSARASAGQAAKTDFIRAGYNATPRAWDFLSIALSVITADLAGQREESADNWTREFDIKIAVADPIFWNTQATALEAALKFLSTDRWQLTFESGGHIPSPPKKPVQPDEDCVVLLSGGLDSLIGAIDLAATNKKPLAVSNIVRGDGENQEEFAKTIGGGLRHIALNHNATPPGKKEPSQRARSLIFIAFGVLAATSLKKYHNGQEVPFYICENGFIAINPPLTGGRIGSLSTRTVHPEFLNRIRDILIAADLRVRIINPYEHCTKGEMLKNCRDQKLLKSLAIKSVSCGRYRVFNYTQCGRCVPCQVRRAAFLAWGNADLTSYKYSNIGLRNDEHANFDDVRSIAMAIADVNTNGLESWLGAALAYPKIGIKPPLKDLVSRGLKELAALHLQQGIR
ncbi:Qat anti-phage system QueC-like protein QatC [Kosakonia sp. MUSA4]|uniref:Qat anti-phage system QueC-like protein QatC n=1 Tax=Kosakonia sp. MUSA4 TaxID=2067958 RepID=UPI001598B588|nr:Qat anti-phage system QueC-like protein QatC [Kosakonia sp. MUSA4]QJT81414.1 hypothetical protein C0557_15715 [Kosakonia sp. MUSA4]